MSKQYSPKDFLRKTPNKLLKQYFEAKGLLGDIKFERLKETKIDPIYEALIKLDDDVRTQIEQHFKQIDELATDKGIQAILDEGNYHDENLVEHFTPLDSNHAKAFWTWLERPQYLEAAIAFNHADTLSKSHWRKHKSLPRKKPNTSEAAIKAFEKAICEYYRQKQGRGNHCKIDVYQRGDHFYFFAYPQDYAQAIIEWEGEKFQRRPTNPAFENIFIYSPTEGSLEISIEGSKAVISDLQAIFGSIILEEEITPESKNDKVYDLKPLRSRHFVFKYDPLKSNIMDVLAKKLRLGFYDGKKKIVLESQDTHKKHAVYDLLAELEKGIAATQFYITQVGCWRLRKSA